MSDASDSAGKLQYYPQSLLIRLWINCSAIAVGLDYRDLQVCDQFLITLSRGFLSVFSTSEAWQSIFLPTFSVCGYVDKMFVILCNACNTWLVVLWLKLNQYCLLHAHARLCSTEFTAFHAFPQQSLDLRT